MNFSFVEESWPAIAQCGRLAEQHVYSDPEASLMRLRQLLEAGMAVWLGPERPADLFTAIGELGDRLALGEEVLGALHRVRKLGNRAAHHDPDKHLEPMDALVALRMAHRAVAELSARLLDPPPVAPPFGEPERRTSHEELERLLVAKELELQGREAAAAEALQRIASELDELRAQREQEVDAELKARRQRLTRAQARELAQREAGQESLFAVVGQPSPALAAMEAEFAAYRAERLAEIDRELAALREQHEREAEASLPTFLRRHPEPPVGEPMAQAEVGRGLPGAPLAMTLWTRYGDWLGAGVPSDRILALLESTTRTAWTGLLKGEPVEHLVPSLRPPMPAEGLERVTGAQRVHTPISWLQSELQRWWPLVDAALTARGLPPVAPVAGPCFVKVTLAQHLLEHFTRASREGEGGLLARARTPRPMQNVQLLDALARTIEHGGTLFGDGGEPCRALSDEVARRLMEGAERTSAARQIVDEERQVLEAYLEGMLSHRILDFALATDVFLGLLWPHPGYREHFLATTSHLLFENLDEASPRMLAFVEEIAHCGLAVYATLQEDDPDAPVAELFQGGLREHLGADPRGATRLASRMRTVAEVRSVPPFLELGRALHDALHGARRPIPRPEQLVVRLDHVTFPDMLDAVSTELAPLLAGGGPAEIALVVPTLDPLMIWSIRRQIEALGTSLYVFAGTNRLADYRPARLLLSIARLVYREWELPPSAFELRELLEHVTGLDPLRLAPLSERLVGTGELPAPERLGDSGLDAVGLERYQAFHRWLAAAQAAPLEDFSLALREVFARVYAPFALEPEVGVLGEALQRDLSQIGQLIEVAGEFLAVERRIRPGQEAGRGRRFVEYLATSPILERPFYKREPRRDAVMLGTANQLAERGYRAPGERLRHLFMLDVGSEHWWKPDRKELVNPRTLSHRWVGGTFGPEDARRFMDQKLARVLFACCLKPTESLHLHGCLVDAEGRENLGELPGLLEALLPRAGVRA